MRKNVSITIALSLLILIIITFVFTLKKKQKNLDKIIDQDVEEIHNSNNLENVNYKSKDRNGNEYIITALNGEIDLIDTSIIYLTKVRAIIKLVDKDNIIITSNFGKYNIDNYDTIFTDNVKIDYTENTITGEYLDFSLNKNKMIISRNVIFTNLDNILKADVIEVNVSTKDTKIFMYNTKKKVKVKNKD